MGKWLIGCSTAVLIVLVVLVILGVFVVREFREIGDSLAESTSRIDELEGLFPFERPEGGVLDQNRFARYLAARKLIAGEARVLLKDLGEGSALRRISTGFRGVRRILPVFERALMEARMSPAEYRFHTFEVLFALQAARRAEPAGRYPALAGVREAFEKTFETLRRDLQVEAAGRILLAIDPERLAVPEKNLALVAGHASELEGSVEAALVEHFLGEWEAKTGTQEGKPPPHPPGEAADPGERDGG